MSTQTYVYIVESPAPADMFDGRTEGIALREAFKTLEVNSSYVLATTLEQFERAFAIGFPESHFGNEYARNSNWTPPIIHLSMHGDNNGVQLTDGTIVTWDRLRAMLTPINNLFPLGVMVCLSSCQGAASSKLSMYEQGGPFYATVGSSEDVYWADALVGFIAFYHWWSRAQPVTAEECVNRMRAASGHNSFMVWSGADAQRAYIDYAAARRAGERMAPGAASN